MLGAIVRSRRSGGASMEAGLDNAFQAAGAVTLTCAVFTGLWLTRSQPAETAAPQPVPPQGRPTEPSSTAR